MLPDFVIGGVHIQVKTTNDGLREGRRITDNVLKPTSPFIDNFERLKGTLEIMDLKTLLIELRRLVAAENQATKNDSNYINNGLAGICSRIIFLYGEKSGAFWLEGRQDRRTAKFLSEGGEYLLILESGLFNTKVFYLIEAWKKTADLGPDAIEFDGSNFEKVASKASLGFCSESNPQIALELFQSIMEKHLDAELLSLEQVGKEVIGGIETLTEGIRTAIHGKGRLVFIADKLADIKSVIESDVLSIDERKKLNETDLANSKIREAGFNKRLFDMCMDISDLCGKEDESKPYKTSVFESADSNYVLEIETPFHRHEYPNWARILVYEAGEVKIQKEPIAVRDISDSPLPEHDKNKNPELALKIFGEFIFREAGLEQPQTREN
jgi:hypothetical protein